MGFVHPHKGPDDQYSLSDYVKMEKVAYVTDHMSDPYRKLRVFKVTLIQHLSTIPVLAKS